MSFYGPITEHEEYSILDSRRFTVQIMPHEFSLGHKLPFIELLVCICGFEENHPVHKTDSDKDAVLKSKLTQTKFDLNNLC